MVVVEEGLSEIPLVEHGRRKVLVVQVVGCDDANCVGFVSIRLIMLTTKMFA